MDSSANCCMSNMQISDISACCECNYFQTYENPCDYTYYNILQVFEHSAAQTPHCKKQATKPCLKQTSWTVLLLLAMEPVTVGVRSETRQWNVAQVQSSTRGKDGGAVQSWVASHAQHRVFFYFSNTPPLLCMLYFRAFLFHFFSVSSIKVPLQWQQVVTTVTTVAI